MSIRRLQDVRVASLVGAQANGAPIYVAGQQTVVEVSAPASLGLVEGSNDLQNWVTATSRVDGATALSSLADNTHNEVFERFRHIRCAVAIDAGGPRNFDFGVSVYEEE